MRRLEPTSTTADAQTGTVILAMTDADLTLIKNALNEVVNGLTIDDVPRRLGAPWETARALLHAVRSVRDDRSSNDAGNRETVVLSPGDRRLIGRALDVVLDDIDAAEFQTRLGVEPEEARTLVARIDAVPGRPESDAPPVLSTVPAGTTA